MRAMGSKNTKKTFFSGVLLLTLSTLLVKLTGLFYKIPMLSYLGTEGMGYFNSAYEIYALFCIISTAGLPVALSVMISSALAKGDGEGVQRIWRVTLWVFLLIGTGGSLAMWWGAEWFCTFLKSPLAEASIRAIAPTVFLICLSSGVRGYFQGHQKMLPTALSQVIESVGKLFFGILLARYALRQGMSTPVVAAYAALGLTLSTAASTLYLLLVKWHFSKKPEREGKKSSVLSTAAVFKRLCRLAIPMTLGAALAGLTKMIDMAMILRRLQSIGYDPVEANRAYGSYTTLALSVFGILPSLINAVSLPLIPMLSACISKGDREGQAAMVRSSYRLTALFSLPAAIGLSAFARPVLLLLFGTDPGAVDSAAPLLSSLGISVFLSCMITATNGVLHAYQVVTRPILAMLAGAVVKTVSAYILIGTPIISMFGAPLSTLLCNGTVVLFNLSFAKKLCPAPSASQVFGKPMLAASLAVALSFVFYTLTASYLGEHLWLTLTALLAVFVLYLLFCCRFGIITGEDLDTFPGGLKIYHLLSRLRLLKQKAEK